LWLYPAKGFTTILSAAGSFPKKFNGFYNKIFKIQIKFWGAFTTLEGIAFPPS